MHPAQLSAHVHSVCARQILRVGRGRGRFQRLGPDCPAHGSAAQLESAVERALRSVSVRCEQSFSTTSPSQLEERQLISSGVATASSLRRHLIKLERYREDQHGPCARMTRTNREMVQIFLRFCTLVPGSCRYAPERFLFGPWHVPISYHEVPVFFQVDPGHRFLQIYAPTRLLFSPLHVSTSYHEVPVFFQLAPGRVRACGCLAGALQQCN